MLPMTFGSLGSSGILNALETPIGCIFWMDSLDVHVRPT